MENDGEDHAARVVLALSSLPHPFLFQASATRLSLTRDLGF